MRFGRLGIRRLRLAAGHAPTNDDGGTMIRAIAFESDTLARVYSRDDCYVAFYGATARKHHIFIPGEQWVRISSPHINRLMFVADKDGVSLLRPPKR